MGVANLKFFLLFLLYIFTMAVYALSLVAWRFFSCLGSGDATLAALRAHASSRMNDNGGVTGPAALLAGLPMSVAVGGSAPRDPAPVAAAAANVVGHLGRRLLEAAAAGDVPSVAGDDVRLGGGAQPHAVLSTSGSGSVDNGSCALSAGGFFMLMWTVIISVLFAIFTAALFADQVSNLISGSTAIDRLKAQHAARSGRSDAAAGPGPTDGASATAAGDDEEDRLLAAAGGGSPRRRNERFWNSLGEIFGGDPLREGVRLTWLLPTPITYPNPEELTGFCFRDVPRPRSLREQEEV